MSTRELIKYTDKEVKQMLKDNSIYSETYCQIKGIYPKEHFKQVIYNDLYIPYIISSYGRLFSINYHSITGLVKEIEGRHDKDGYQTATVTFDGIAKTIKLHRFVATMFIDNPENKEQVNHKNGIKDDNHVWNLEWVTNAENMKHARENGLIKDITCGERVWCHIYSKDQIRKVCEMLTQNKSFDDIHKETGVARYTISDILAKRKWKQISCDYDFSNYHYGKDVETIRKACELIMSNDYNQTQISRMTGIDIRRIHGIIHGLRDKDIAHDYDLSNFNNNTQRKV